VAIGPHKVSANADVDTAPFTAALDRGLQRPYRGEAVYRGDERWAVGGRRVEIDRTLLLDGTGEFGTIPQLERPEHVCGRPRRRLGGRAAPALRSQRRRVG
jgi:hypothetical protein